MGVFSVLFSAVQVAVQSLLLVLLMEWKPEMMKQTTTNHGSSFFTSKLPSIQGEKTNA
jgi:hypothetical protein